MAQIIIVNHKGIKMDDWNSDIIPMAGDTFVEKWETTSFSHYKVVGRLLNARSNVIVITVEENNIIK